jgi:hypothetical protein
LFGPLQKSSNKQRTNETNKTNKQSSKTISIQELKNATQKDDDDQRKPKQIEKNHESLAPTIEEFNHE